jgi:hypothetical protein
VAAAAASIMTRRFHYNGYKPTPHDFRMEMKGGQRTMEEFNDNQKESQEHRQDRAPVVVRFSDQAEGDLGVRRGASRSKPRAVSE